MGKKKKSKAKSSKTEEKVLNENSVVYFSIDNNNPPEEARKFIDYIECSIALGIDGIVDEDILRRQLENIESWAIREHLCINQEFRGGSIIYYVTTTYSWLNKNYNSLLKICTYDIAPEKDHFGFDRKVYKEYSDDNVGFSTIGWSI